MVINRTRFNQLEIKVAKAHCFTLRLPPDLYIEVYERSEAQNKTMNTIVVDLIKIAVSQQISVRKALQDMLNREFGPDAIVAEE